MYRCCLTCTEILLAARECAKNKNNRYGREKRTFPRGGGLFPNDPYGLPRCGEFCDQREGALEKRKLHSRAFVGSVTAPDFLEIPSQTQMGTSNQIVQLVYLSNLKPDSYICIGCVHYDRNDGHDRITGTTECHPLSGNRSQIVRCKKTFMRVQKIRASIPVWHVQGEAMRISPFGKPCKVWILIVHSWNWARQRRFIKKSFRSIIFRAQFGGGEIIVQKRQSPCIFNAL